jgi:sulfatase modifying factor 1
MLLLFLGACVVAGPPPDPSSPREIVDAPAPVTAPPADPCADLDVEGMVCFPAGTSTLGGDAPHACDQGEVLRRPNHHMPARTVSLSAFFLDSFEVSHASYQACVHSGACPRRQPNYADFRRPEVPMTGVTWYEAETYCRAQGKRLPTEAEFERAARRGDALHPWGEEPADCARAVIHGPEGRACGNLMRGSAPEKGRPLPSGSRPAFAGVHDIIGNVEEWVSDWYVPLSECGEACEGHDPSGPCAGQSECPVSTTKVVKGGSWYWGPACATATNRRPHTPTNNPYHHFGFRCAASVDQVRASK